jgi:hypothetical protein
MQFVACMKPNDVRAFDDVEKHLLEGSFVPHQIQRRMRTIVVVSALVAAVVVFFGFWSATTARMMTVAFVAYIAVATIEKLVFAQTLLRFESLVRKLVHRIESLEGVPLTPDEANHVNVTREGEASGR